MSKMQNVVVENAKIMFRNFSGAEGKFNPAGRRNFCVFLDSGVGHQLKKDGWNIRWLQPRDDDGEEQAYLQVKVSFSNKPPKIVMVSSKGKTAISEETVNILDWADIKSADLVITPYEYSVNGRSGVSAYLKTLYVTIEEDEIEQKYANAPDSAEGCIGGCGNCDICDGGCAG